MIREQVELNLLIEILDIHKDKVGQFTIQLNHSKLDDDNIDITVHILNKKKKTIEYVDIYEDITVDEANEKALILKGWFVEDPEFKDFYSNRIEENYKV